MRFLNSTQRADIGFSYILDNIDTVSKLGNDRKIAVTPFTRIKFQDLIIELDNTKRMIQCVQSKNEGIGKIGDNLCRIKDIVPTIKKLGTGVVLDEIELFELKSFSKISSNIDTAYKSLKEDFNGISFEDTTEVFAMLDPDKSGFDTFYIYDSFSYKLLQLRNARRKLEEAIGSSANADRRSELLLERSEILSKEHDEEFVIRKMLTNSLIQYKSALLINAEKIGYLDFLIAKSKYSISSKATLPQMTNKDEPIVLQKVYNPLYADILMNKKLEMQRLDLTLARGVTVLTGANMGGKSISMKTVALNVLLGNCGFFVYAEKAQIPAIDFLYMVSDDLQSIGDGLSTFGAEMIQLKKIIGASKKKDGLIVFDELARGTNPTEARNIINGVIEFYKKQKSYTFISTHFDGIDSVDVDHLQVVGISKVNFHNLMDFVRMNSKEALNILQKNMDYTIEKIDAFQVPQNALQIAELLGINEINFGRKKK